MVKDNNRIIDSLGFNLKGIEQSLMKCSSGEVKKILIRKEIEKVEAVKNELPKLTDLYEKYMGDLDLASGGTSHMKEVVYIKEEDDTSDFTDKEIEELNAIMIAEYGGEEVNKENIVDERKRNDEKFTEIAKLAYEDFIGSIENNDLKKITLKVDKISRKYGLLFQPVIKLVSQEFDYYVRELNDSMKKLEEPSNSELRPNEAPSTTEGEVVKTSVQPNKEWLNTEEAAEYLGYALSYMYKLNHRKSIKYYKPNGKENRYKKIDLDEFLSKNKKKSKGEIEQEEINRIVLSERR